MNVRKIRSRKALKFLGLLITAMIIATVSAVTYRYMYIDGSITVGAPKMIWILGGDAPTGAQIQGSTAVMDFSVENGTPQTFTDALFLKNADNTANYTYNITITTGVGAAQFQTAKMHIYENYTAAPTFNLLNTLDLTNSSDYYSDALNSLKYLRMTFEINATVTTGTFDFDIQVEYWKP